MKILVIGGGGQIGRAVAWDLAKKCDDVETVGVADVKSEALQRVKDLVNSRKLVMHSLDVNDKDATLNLIQQYDICVSTLPDRGTSYGAIEAAVDAGVDFVDILEECHKCPDVEEDERLDHHGMVIKSMEIGFIGVRLNEGHHPGWDGICPGIEQCHRG